MCTIEQRKNPNFPLTNIYVHTDCGSHSFIIPTTVLCLPLTLVLEEKSSVLLEPLFIFCYIYNLDYKYFPIVLPIIMTVLYVAWNPTSIGKL